MSATEQTRETTRNEVIGEILDLLNRQKEKIVSGEGTITNFPELPHTVQFTCLTAMDDLISAVRDFYDPEMEEYQVSKYVRWVE